MQNQGTEVLRHRDTVSLAHGSGGRLTHDLVRDLFAKYFNNEYLSTLSDSAEIKLSALDILFTTDSYVVKPLKFPGGDIGKLAVCGTINDLAVMGARPAYISCSLIIEEGLELTVLKDIIGSMSKTADEAGVMIITGDTKVVEKGAADRLFINTAGIGLKIGSAVLGMGRIEAGDKILINGCVGDHGMAVMAAREGLGLSSNIKSDCSPLHKLIEAILQTASDERQVVKFMRDPTRGGLATTLCEIAESTGYDIEIDEKAVPISDSVKGISEVLGIDPLYSANEGKVVVVVSPDAADSVLKKMRFNPLGKNAQIIGAIKKGHGRVHLKTVIGTSRRITMLTSSQLPRIC